MVVGSPALDSGLALCGVTLVDVMCVPIGICLMSLCLHGLGLDFSRSYGPGQPHVFLIMAAISGEGADGAPALTCPPAFKGIILGECGMLV